MRKSEMAELEDFLDNVDYVHEEVRLANSEY